VSASGHQDEKMTVSTQKTSRAESVQKVVSPAAGIEAWLVEDYAVPLVAFDFAFRGGSAQESAAKSGASSMLGALLDEGAGDLDAQAFHRALDDKAVEISFSADRDTFHGRMKTLTRHLDAAVGLLRLAVNQPRLDADAIERVRAQMIAGLKRELKDPDTLAGKAWREAAFGDHPYAQSGRGTLESVPAIARDDLAALRAAMMARDTLKIAVVGAIDAGKLATVLDTVFAGLPSKGSLKDIRDVSVGNLGARKLVDLDVPQSTIRFGLPGIARHDPDFWIAVVVNHILGGGVFSARLFREVREKRGLAYSVHSQLATFDHTTMFSGGTSTKNERAAESLSVIEEEIAKLCADGPTEEELDKGKKYLIGSYALRFDTSTKIAGNLVGLQNEGYPVEFLDERNEYIRSVTLDQTRRVARRLFEGKKLLVATAGRPQGM
jgi:zinc protease